MKGYKAFKKGLICDPTGKNPFQFKENTVFEEESAEICKNGFHFCKNPLDVLDYYPLIDSNGDMNEFAEVEALDEVLTDDNKKYCTKKLKIGAKLTLPDFISASVKVTYENIKTEVDEATKGKRKTTDKVQAGGSYSTLAGGDNSTLAGGAHSIIVGDNGSIAKGKKGALLVITERVWKNDEYIITNFKAELVDGERIKEDTFYKLENGEFTEVKEN